MSYRWPEKDPDETADFSVDWSRFLGADSLVSAQWFIDDANGTKTGPLSNGTTVNGLQFIAPTTSGNVATARFAGGTNNLRYKTTCRITSAQGLTYERSITLPVRDR
tara:strand:+ start:199 stop:519 length:321 start_codon:yes stop_codon:yes gene_type:complete